MEDFAKMMIEIYPILAGLWLGMVLGWCIFDLRFPLEEKNVRNLMGLMGIAVVLCLLRSLAGVV